MGCTYYCQNSLRLDAVPNPAGRDIGDDNRPWLFIDRVDPTIVPVRPTGNATTDAILESFGY
jgi:hypothetical protein